LCKKEEILRAKETELISKAEQLKERETTIQSHELQIKQKVIDIKQKLDAQNTLTEELNKREATLSQKETTISQKEIEIKNTSIKQNQQKDNDPSPKNFFFEVDPDEAFSSNPKNSLSKSRSSTLDTSDVSSDEEDVKKSAAIFINNTNTFDNNSTSSKQQAAPWIPDKDANNCTSCNKKFSVTKRKHHCRKCGKIYCNVCTKKRHTIDGYTKPVRVCDACNKELST